MNKTLRKEYLDKAFLLHNAGKIDEAKNFYNKIINENFDDAETYNLIGICELQQKKYDSAEAYIKKALGFKKSLYFYSMLAHVYSQQNRFEDEILLWQEAQTTFGLNFDIAFSLALAYKNTKNYELAKNYYLMALEFNPNSKEACFNLAGIYFSMQEIEKSIIYYKRCLELDPNDRESEYFLSHAYLRLKDYKNGLKHFEARLCRQTAIETTKVTYPNLYSNSKLWQGEDLSDKVLYTYYEAGFGDMIMFARYIPELAKRCKKLIVKPQIELYQLFKDNFPQAEIMEYFYPEKDFHFDYHIPFLSIPYMMKLNTEEIFMNKCGYMKADIEKSDLYKEKIFYNNDTYKIAIKWQGNTYYDTDRVINVEAFAPLFKLKNTQVYSAQTFEGSENFQKLSDKFSIVDISRTFKDFSYTAAAIDNVDLVICNDTSLAHLCGAIGKKCIILLPYNYNWRYHNDLTKCDWYDSVKLYRLGQNESWNELMIQVADDIKTSF